LVLLHTQPPQFVTKVSERPVASPLARAQASHGGVVTSMSHKCVDIEDTLSVKLLQLLDGARDHAALLDELTGFIANKGDFTRQDGAPITVEREIGRIVSEGLAPNLSKFAKMGLLVD